MGRTIKFSENWNNKLGCHIFTTIRSYNKEKHEHYLNNVGLIFDVELHLPYLEGNPAYGQARLIDVDAMNVNDMQDATLLCDVGRNSREAALAVLAKFGIGRGEPCILLTFERLI